MLLETVADHEFAERLVNSVNTLAEAVKELKDPREPEIWDVSWTNIVDSINNTDTGEDIPRFHVSGKDEILCRTTEDADCIEHFLNACGFDVKKSQDPGYYPRTKESKTYKWKVFPVR